MKNHFLIQQLFHRYCILFIGISFFALTGFTKSFATLEPAFCDPGHFPYLEITPNLPNAQKLNRLHLFKLGKVIIAGMGIKKSPTPVIESLAESFSPTVKSNNYCTWYFATTNSSAKNELNNIPITPMQQLTVENAPLTFMDALESSFFEEENSFFYCAATHGYIGLGCNDQAHRGPTVFGMILAFSGCTPEHSNVIATNIWGLNGISAQMRLNVINAAYEFGNSHPIERQMFSSLLN